jgi:hypothetical protein
MDLGYGGAMDLGMELGHGLDTDWEVGRPIARQDCSQAGIRDRRRRLEHPVT